MNSCQTPPSNIFTLETQLASVESELGSSCSCRGRYTSSHQTRFDLFAMYPRLLFERRRDSLRLCLPLYLCRSLSFLSLFPVSIRGDASWSMLSSQFSLKSDRSVFSLFRASMSYLFSPPMPTSYTPVAYMFLPSQFTPPSSCTCES